MPVTQAPSTRDKAVIVGNFPHCPPEILFDYWTMSTLITLWWPPDAEIDPRLDGTYHLSWPNRNWHLRGHYTTFEPGRELAFTWQWGHHLNLTFVSVTFEPIPSGGTKLTVIHGPYSNSAVDQEARKGHLEGWLYFLTRLQDIQP